MGEWGIVLLKQDLVWGSMRPDFVKHPIPHFWDEGVDLLCAKWDDLCVVDRDRQPQRFSVELGEMYHFLCDYFCYAHNEPSLMQEVWPHLKYENELHRYVKRIDFQTLKISEADYSMISFPDLVKYKHSLFQARRPSFENDLKSSFEICMIVTKMLLEQPSKTAVYRLA